MDSIAKSILLMVLAVTRVCCVNADTKIGVDKSSEEEFQADGFESTSDDQDQDGTSQEDVDAHINENPGNFYMDLYSIQTGPKQVEFGHVYENPHTWEKRYEKKDHENKRFQGQVLGDGSYTFSYRRGDKNHMREHRQIVNPHTGQFKIQALWGDKNGGYGEQYWDYNHGGPDDHEEPNEDPYGEPSLNVRSPSVSPSVNPSGSPFSSSYPSFDYPSKSTVSPFSSTFPSVDYSSKSTTYPPSTTLNPKRKYPKKNRKRYEEPARKRKPTAEETTKTEENYFTIPRERDASHSSDTNDGPFRIDLYEELKAFPTAYEHLVQITPSTPRQRASNMRP